MRREHASGGFNLESRIHLPLRGFCRAHNFFFTRPNPVAAWVSQVEIENSIGYTNGISYRITRVSWSCHPTFRRFRKVFERVYVYVIHRTFCMTTWTMEFIVNVIHAICVVIARHVLR